MSEEEERAERCSWMQSQVWNANGEGKKERERGVERKRGWRRSSELKRLVLPNEVNTAGGRMRRLPCRAETLVTSVILYKAVVRRGEGQL